MRFKSVRSANQDPNPRIPDASLGSTADRAQRQIARIDEFLTGFTCRRLVGATELVDLLLDLRFEITLDASLADLWEASSAHGRTDTKVQDVQGVRDDPTCVSRSGRRSLGRVQR